MTNKWLRKEIRKMIKEVSTHKFLIMAYGFVKALHEEERGVGDE